MIFKKGEHPLIWPMPGFRYLTRLGIAASAMLVAIIVRPSTAEAGVISWGLDTFGQLGLGDDGISRRPIPLPQSGALADKKVVSAAMRLGGGVVLTSDGGLYCWGSQLGNGTSSTSLEPVAVDMTGALAGKTVTAIAAGFAHFLALTQDGQVFGWGVGGGGALGQGDWNQQLSPVAITGGALSGKTVLKIATGSSVSMALTTEGKLVAWGSNTYGGLGDGTTTARNLPVSVSGLDGVTITSMSCGGSFTLAVDSNGRAYAWGYNAFGQLGDGTRTSRSSPSVIFQPGAMAGKAVVGVAAGSTHSLALCHDGTVFSWGQGTRGQLGNAATIDNLLPVPVEMNGALFGKQVIGLSAGQYTSQALTADGDVVCWGANDWGQIGDGTDLQRSTPSPIYRDELVAGTTLTQVTCTTNASTVAAVTLNGKLLMWGSGKNGEFGNGEHHRYQSVPHEIALKAEHTTIRGLATGAIHSLTIADQNSYLYSWGFDGNGQLANYDPLLYQSSKPGAASLSSSLSSVAAGSSHSMALTSGGKVYTFGSNYNGEIGAGTSTPGYSTPYLVTGLLTTKTVTAIAAGSSHCLALTADNKLFSWGAGTDGQLGNGSSQNATAPVEVNMDGVMLGKTIVAIAAGTTFSLALASDGTVFAWGRNSSGQLGSGAGDAQANPVAVDLSGLAVGSRVTSIAAGSRHGLLITQIGEVYGWGSNDRGELGLGHTDSPQWTPVPMNAMGVFAGKQARKVQGGSGFSVVLSTDGEVFTTGANTYGTLGTGDSSDSSSLVPVLATSAVAGHIIQDIGAGPTSQHVLAVAAPTGPELFVTGWEYHGGYGEFSYVNRISTMAFRRTAISGSGSSETLNIHNRGVAPLTGISASIIGPDADRFQIMSPLPAQIAVGGNASLDIAFTPDADKIFDATLEITSNDPANPVFRLKLSGRGAVPPGIVPLPTTTNRDPGQELSLVVTPTGTGPFTFQWAKDSNGSTLIAGALGKALIIPAVAETDENTYTIKVSADPILGTTTDLTTSTRLIVTDPPNFLSPTPYSIDVDVGSSLAMPLQPVSGAVPITYQWERNGVPLPGAVSRSLGINNMTPGEAGFYRLIATNRIGTVMGPPITVSVNVSVAPVITQQPVSAIVLAGTSHNLNARIYGADPLKVQWYKNSLKIAGSTAQSRVFKAVTAADAGVYHLYGENHLGTATTTSAELSVLQRAPKTAAVKAGGLLTLNAAVTTPKNAAVAYAWLKDGQPIAAEEHISGLDTATLKISAFAAANEGAYDCRVSVTASDGPMVQQTHGETFVHIPKTPAVADFVIPEVVVGTPITYAIVASNYPSRYLATGLPPGLKLDSTLGIITGYPTSAKRVNGVVVPYVFAVSASNSAGTSSKATCSFLVQPLPTEMIGTFGGLIGRDPVGNANLGGSFRFTVTATGMASGTLTLGTKAYPFTTSLKRLASADTSFHGGVETDLFIDGGVTRFSVSIDPITTTVDGQLSTNVFSVVVSGQGMPWSAAKLATNYAGTYNHAFSLPESLRSKEAYPQGHGFATLTISATGTATWVGTLADGSSFTCSGQFGKRLRMPLLGLNANKTGSILGWSDLGLGPPDESMDWFKSPSTTPSISRSYKNGIPLHSLRVIAALYRKPNVGEIILGMQPVAAPATNGLLTFRNAYLPDPYAFNQAFTVTESNAVKLPTGDANPFGVKLTITPSTGKITGNFTIVTNDPRDTILPIAKITRTVTYNGLFIPLAGFNQGLGHFNLPELPDTTGESIHNTTLWSGSVELTEP